MVTQSALGQGVESASLHVRLEPAIPCFGVKGSKPLPECGKLLGREPLNFSLNLLYLGHTL